MRRRGVSEDIAADLTQDAFVRLLCATPADQSDNARAYLFRISRNLLVDHQRRQRAAPFDPASDETVGAVADTIPSAETAIYDRQRLAIVAAALTELPDRSRKAFLLHRLAGKTLTEIGPEVGLSTTQTWSVIRDAYRHIRSRLRDI
jgi:RNA polymerase sigma factor (sigma-70 family)